MRKNKTKKHQRRTNLDPGETRKTQTLTPAQKLAENYVQQKNALEKSFAQKQNKVVANKFVVRKFKHQEALALFDLRCQFQEDKMDLEASVFLRFWMFVGFQIQNFFAKNYLQWTNFWFIHLMNKRKQFTISMVGDVWYKRLTAVFFRTLFLVVMGIIVLFPFYWMISISFRTSDEIRDGITGPLAIWPKEWSWGAFNFLFNNPNPALDVSISKAIGVSFGTAFLSIICQTSISLLAGFGLSHLHSRANEFFIMLLLATMMLPGEALLMGQYLLATKINMKDTFPALFVPFIGNAFTIFMFINAFSGINDSVKRAAKIDGLSNFKFFFKVAIPLISSTIFTAMLISMIASWNAVLWPQMVIQQNKQYYTLPMILWQIINSTGDPNGVWNYDNMLDPQNLKMAASIISILPMFILFIFTKKYLVKGITKDSGAKE